MKNIWLIFGTIVIASIVLLVIGTILFVRKEKHYILSSLIIIVLVLVCLLSDIPYMKDLAKQETTEIVAVYVKYEKGNVHPGALRLFFENEDNQYDLLVPVITRDSIKMEFGKTYKIEYYNNSKVIKKYTIVE